jgi:hypothetical protein
MASSRTATLTFEEGYKYALLSLPRLNAVTDGNPVSAIADGYALTTSLPVEDIDEWEKTFGWYRYRNMAKAGHYLVVYAPSTSPAVLDDENRVLNRRLHRIHLGVLIACPFLSHEESVFLEGARRNGRTEIRGHTTYPTVVGLLHGPVPLLKATQLAFAYELAGRTRQVRRLAAGKRFGRVLSAYRAGLHERSVDARLHQFVRCVEGFLGSWRKENFADRALELVRGVSRPELLQIYDIRSAVEHLSGWERAVNVGGRLAKETTLVERAVQSQGMAQSFISRFLEVPALWSHYADNRAVKHFWSESDGKQRSVLWGAQFDIGRFTRHLDFSQIRAALHKPQ